MRYICLKKKTVRNFLELRELCYITDTGYPEEIDSFRTETVSALPAQNFMYRNTQLVY